MPTSRCTSVRHESGTRKPRDSSRCSPRRTPRTRPGEQGVVVLGSRLLSRILRVSELQSAWLLLPYFATNPAAGRHGSVRRRARCCHPALLGDAAGGRGWRHATFSYRRAKLLLSMGGLGLGSAERIRHAAYWSSWAGTVRALRKHQPCVLAALLRPLLDASATGTPPSTRAAEQAARFLRSEGFSAPTWARLLEEDVAAPAPRTTRPAPGGRPGWQRAASKTRKPSTSARSRCSSTTSTLRLEPCCCHRLAM